MDSELKRLFFTTYEILFVTAISERHTKKENKNWYGKEEYGKDDGWVKVKEGVSEKECRPQNKSYKQNVHSF